MHGLNPADDPALTSYGNPNITTERGPMAAASNRARVAVRLHFTNLITGEKEYLIKHSKNADFSARAESYYRLYRRRLDKLCDKLSLPRDLAEDHCEQSQGELLEAMALSTPEQLPSAVETITQSWETRAERFVEHV